MPQSYMKKPLGEWPDQKKHDAAETLDEEGEQLESGSDPDSEHITGADENEPRDTLDMAHDARLYQHQTEDRQGELGLAETEEEDIEEEEES